MGNPTRLGRALEYGEGVFLRRPRASDEGEYRRLMKASEAFLKPWFPRPHHGEERSSRKAFRQLLAGARKQRHDKALLCRTEDGAILGGLNLSEIVRGSPFT